MPEVGENTEVLEWLEDARTRAGIRSQRELDALTTKQGARISQAYYSLIINGHKRLSELGPEKMEVLRQVLKISPEEWLEKTGYSVITKDTPALTYEYEQYLEIPKSLLKAAKEYGDEYPELNDPDWQRKLAGMRFADGLGPQTPEHWVDQFLLLKKFKRYQNR